MTWDLSDLENAAESRDEMRETYHVHLNQLGYLLEIVETNALSGGDSSDVSNDFEQIEQKVKEIREHLNQMTSHQDLMEQEIKNSEELVELGVNKWISTSQISKLQEQQGYFL